MSEHKKIAPRAATPETKNRKILSINSILKNAGDVKLLIKEPGELPRVISAYDVPPEFVSRKLRIIRKEGLDIVFDSKSAEPMNIACDKTVLRGTVLVVSLGFNRLYNMNARENSKAFVWLMNHKV